MQGPSKKPQTTLGLATVRSSIYRVIFRWSTLICEPTNHWVILYVVLRLYRDIKEDMLVSPLPSMRYLAQESALPAADPHSTVEFTHEARSHL